MSSRTATLNSRRTANSCRRRIPPIYADIGDVIAHIDHVVDLVGVDHVGIGSDYDGVGDSLPTGLKDVSSYPNLIYELLKRGYSEDDVRKIARRESAACVERRRAGGGRGDGGRGGVGRGRVTENRKPQTSDIRHQTSDTGRRTPAGSAQGDVANWRTTLLRISLAAGGMATALKRPASVPAV